MNVKPTRTVSLEHRAHFVGQFPGRSEFIVVGEGETIVHFYAYENISYPRYLPESFGQIEKVAIHPSEMRLALIEDEVLAFVDMNRDEMHTLRIEVDEAIFADCAFDPREPHLWCALRPSPDVVEIQLRDRDSGTLIARCQQEDPYFESHCSLHPNTPNAGMGLWLAAGQDGQQFYWLRRTPDGIECVAEPLLKNTTPPVFSPTGQEFLVGDGNDSLRWYAYPSLEPLGKFSPLWEDDLLGSSFCYLDEKRALILSNEQRLYILDLAQGTLTDEVMIEGHEPKPTSAYYPRLTDSGLCTDITWFDRFGDWIIASFRRDGGVGLEGWKDTLLCLPVAAF